MPPWKGKFASKREVDHYFSNPGGIQCLLCGRTYGTLNGHLQIVHETTHEQYRRRYGLPWLPKFYKIVGATLVRILDY